MTPAPTLPDPYESTIVEVSYHLNRIIFLKAQCHKNCVLWIFFYQTTVYCSIGGRYSWRKNFSFLAQIFVWVICVQNLLLFFRGNQRWILWTQSGCLRHRKGLNFSQVEGKWVEIHQTDRRWSSSTKESVNRQLSTSYPLPSGLSCLKNPPTVIERVNGKRFKEKCSGARAL